MRLVVYHGVSVFSSLSWPRLPRISFPRKGECCDKEIISYIDSLYTYLRIKRELTVLFFFRSRNEAERFVPGEVHGKVVSPRK